MQAVSIKGFRHILVTLTALFTIRVVAQTGSLFFTDSWFPAFDRWSSGVIPYPLLLLSQILVLLLMIAGCLYRQPRNPGAATLRVIKSLALLYFGFMFLRLMISISGITVLPWWQMTLPAFFHLVLAGYLYCIAELHNKLRKREEVYDGYFD